ncbi:ornithine cyclodeaminase family protein [Sporosarcina sp. Te-1]|uniref:ornithine cyclodeaminase family protein n=1 Tax=Sporosarcina sp. Te-1 TaxID=2818390 RepID=UPI001A9F39F4|nr:ornithine cyclodeaminase family protein [Sporosarcina sp. Te-1]QTD40932.1 ornithine cyclodeaminase family protein [Sporosarcina sp. Te-1]
MITMNEAQIMEMYGMEEAVQDVADVLHSLAAGKVENPPRTVIEFPERGASILYMPCADIAEGIATNKTVSIFPGNPKANGMPTTQGVILVTNAKDGRHLALLNASYLTRLRTGAMTALATDRLAKTNASVLCAIGTGGMAYEQVLGVLAVRSIKEILLVNPTESKARTFAERLRSEGRVGDDVTIEIIKDVGDAVRRADIINCATRSTTPVFDGAAIQPGTHVNGVGSYLPHMREVDETFILQCSKIVVDDLHGVQEEAGELIHANRQSDWSFDNLHGELVHLVTGQIKGRELENEITFFKSVGAAYFDLAVAKGVYRKAEKEGLGVIVGI